ncbi:heme exporter protein CcmD, partial [Actinoplanes sp. GCM10030250]|uniref:heme exporter protein CcmD n=1 Tax=Actinoplanes sp. GCM10030250 TaxID=3273376 RepID=UPI0036122310
MPIPPRRRTLPTEVWVALIWGLAVFNTLRGYSGIPGMPAGLPQPPAWCWALIAGSVAAGFAASTQVRRRPLAALYVLVVAAVILVLAVGSQGLAGHPDQMLGYFLIAADIAFGWIVATRPTWVWWVASVPMLTALPVNTTLRAAFRQPDPAGWVGWELNSAVWMAYAVLPALVAGLIGYSVRQAREYARRLSEQAAAQAVVAERLRISRELHDHVAHSVGVIALQAGAAARVMDSQPERARQAMYAIEATSRDTLSGLRRLLGGLRDSE